MVSKLLAVRKQIKKRKPSFRRTQTNQFSKFNGDGYRKPKGMGNKMRRRRRGHVKIPTPGYGSPKELRGADKNGMTQVIVSSVKDLDLVTEKTHIAVIGSTVGAKKKLAILNEAKKRSLAVAYINDIDAAIKKYTKEKKVKAPKKTEAKKATEETKADSKEEAKEKPAAKKAPAKKAAPKKEEAKK